MSDRVSNHAIVSGGRITDDVGGSSSAGRGRSRGTSRGPVRATTGDDGPVESCPVCDRDLTRIVIAVDGSDLLMQSCDFCDTRSWQLGDRRIDLQQALDHVGEHAGRRR